MRLKGLAVMAILLAPGAWPQERRVPPPMFSPQYVQALQGLLEMEPADVRALETRLAADPEDFAARLKLMAYCMRADRVALELSTRQRVELVLWLVEHHPESEILASPYALLEPKDLSGEPLERATRLWRGALQKYPGNPDILWHAAVFYAPRDRQMYLNCAEAAVALTPQDERGGTNLGLFYAQAILDQSSFARLAAVRLETTRNAFVLEGAVKLLQSAYNKSLMAGAEDRRVGHLAEQYFARAEALDPHLDAAWIYPKIDPQMKGMFAPGAPTPQVPPVSANRPYRRLSPNAFPDLPPAIAARLRARTCLIPQPAAAGAPGNVIRGEFFEKGKLAWAVLCLTQGSSVILAFQSDTDAHPAELAPAPDQNYVEDGAYARQISAVDRKFMVEHYRAYGGPEPPPIDHQGIDDAFLEKASVTYYWYQGQWRKLTGSD
jgi:hypothetical protein